MMLEARTLDEYRFDVFLSHNSQNKSYVRQLAIALRDTGLRVWFDEWTIQPGDDIYLEIERGIEASRNLILCMSKAAFDSDWVSLERSTSIFRDPSNKQRRFVPLLIQDCEIPDVIRRLLYIDGRILNDDTIEQIIQSCQINETHASRGQDNESGKHAAEDSELANNGPIHQTMKIPELMDRTHELQYIASVNEKYHRIHADGVIRLDKYTRIGIAIATISCVVSIPFAPYGIVTATSIVVLLLAVLFLTSSLDWRIRSDDLYCRWTELRIGVEEIFLLLNRHSTDEGGYAPADLVRRHEILVTRRHAIERDEPAPNMKQLLKAQHDENYRRYGVRTYEEVRELHANTR